MKPIHHFWFSTFACLAMLALLATLAEAAVPADAYGRAPLRFEANHGQTDLQILYVARQGQGSVLLTRNALSIAHGDSLVTLRPAGARAVEPVAEQPLPSRSRYILPRGRVVAPHFGRVRYAGVYPGIDLIYYGDPVRLEHDFVVAPGADPSQIGWQVEGADALHLDADGGLALVSPDGELRLLAPVAYQFVDGERRPVEAAFELTADRTVTFRLGDYDASRELIIDPVLDYGSYLGGGRADTHAAIRVNANGEAYVVGATRSLDFPASTGAAQPAYAGGSCGGAIVASPCFDVFVAKLNADGSDLLWATYFGGTGNDLPADAALNAAGHLAVVGTTESHDFPASAGALQTTSSDAAAVRSDAFVLQLDAEGELVYATLLGGSSVDQATAIALGDDGAAAVVGHTESSDFPVTGAAAQPSKAGDAERTDVFFARLNPAGSALSYSTFLGGRLDERGGGVALLADGRFAVSGSTGSADFPLGAGASPIATAGGADAFVALFSEQAYEGGLLLGGSGSDAGGELVADGDQGLYLIGSTDSRDLPATANAPLPVWKRSLGFLAHYTPGDAKPDFLTYVVGSADELSVDEGGSAWVSGVTGSSSPLFGGPVVPGCNGSLLRRYDGARLAYSGFLPGLGDIAAVREGVVFSAGTSAGATLRTTPGAFQPSAPGQSDVYVSKWTVADADEISITCVEHGASFTPGEVAPGQLVSLFGSGLGRPNPAGLVVENGRVTTEVDGVQVLFNGEPAPLLFVWWNQINVVAPYGIAGSEEVEIVVVKDGVESEPFVLPVSDAHPGLFTRDSTGSGVGALLNADGTINTADNPAQAGSIVTLYGTGEGRPDRNVPNGSVIGDILAELPRPVLPVTVTIGDQTAEVAYAGSAPELVAGVLQINVRIPAGTPPGLAPLRVTIGGKFNRQPVFVAVQ
ncbi:MAG: hypothetical protein GC160_06480 [Acidobacteria bacterium]|nr:hypothetical protein [Acidobacteriota bacterium]